MRVLYVLLHVCVHGDVLAYLEVHVLLCEHLVEMMKHDVALRHGIISCDIMRHDMTSVFVHPCYLRMSKVLDIFLQFIRI